MLTETLAESAACDSEHAIESASLWLRRLRFHLAEIRTGDVRLVARWNRRDVERATSGMLADATSAETSPLVIAEDRDAARAVAARARRLVAAHRARVMRSTSAVAESLAENHQPGDEIAEPHEVAIIAEGLAARDTYGAIHRLAIGRGFPAAARMVAAASA